MLNAILSPILFLKAFVTLILNPKRTDQIFAMAELGIASRDRRGVDAVVNRARSDDAFERCRSEGYLPPHPDLDELSALPPGTLGRELADAMRADGFDPAFYKDIAPSDDISYIELRLRRTHDIWHVVLGFGTDIEGELGLQGFMLAQNHSGISAAILAAGLLHTTLRSPDRLASVMGTIVEGYRLGLSTPFFLGVRFEKMWTHPLSEVRRRVGLENPAPTRLPARA